MSLSPSPSESENLRSYVIWRTYGAGFWSIVASTLAHCDLAEKSGYVPVVDMGNYPAIYQEQSPVNGTNNVWEYYFEQPQGRGIKNIGPDAIITDGTIPRDYPREIGHDRYRELWKKFAIVKKETGKKIAKNVGDLGTDSRTLGVHFRGQEMRTAIGHKFPPKLSQMNDAIAHAWDTGDFDEILLVTEAQQYADSLRRRWGSRLKITPTYRLRYRNSYTLREYPRPLHRYQLGFEALQDAHILAACGGLVCGHSGLSEAAVMLRESPFPLRIRISQGRNSFRPYVSPWLWYYKSLVPRQLGGFPKWLPDSH